MINLQTRPKLFLKSATTFNLIYLIIRPKGTNPRNIFMDNFKGLVINFS